MTWRDKEEFLAILTDGRPRFRRCEMHYMIKKTAGQEAR